jgi:hypothetical protein
MYSPMEYKFSPNALFCYFAHIIELYNKLLQIEIYSYITNHTTDIIRYYYFLLYEHFITY